MRHMDPKAGACPVYNAGRCDLTVYLYRTTGWLV